MHNFWNTLLPPWANQIVNSHFNGESPCLGNLSFSALEKDMFTKRLLDIEMNDAGHHQQEGF